MASDRSSYNQLDKAVAHYLVDAAEVEPAEAGDLVTPEELATCAEGDAAEVLGAKRWAQIKYQIASNSAIYEQWMDMLEFVEAIEQESTVAAAPPKQKNSHSVWHQVKAWFEPVALPRLALAAGFGAFAVFLVTANFGGQGDELRVKQGEQLPQKASIDHVDSDEPVVGSDKLDSWFECAYNSDARDNICYSKTLNSQHWLYVSSAEMVYAIGSPLAAERILASAGSDKYIAIHSLTANRESLSVFEIDRSGGIPALVQRFSQSSGDRYFRLVGLADGALTYELITDDGQVETKRFDIRAGQ